MILVQTFFSLFLLFALSRVIMQVRSAKLTIGGFLFWSGLFIFALVGVLEPDITSHAAKFFGIGRGADVVIYISIALLFYLIFRISITIEEIRGEISDLVRKIALEKKMEQQTRKKRRKTR